MFDCCFQLTPSSETQGWIVGARKSPNGRKNKARRKVKNGKKSSSRRSLLFFVPYFSARLDFPSPPLSAAGSPRMSWHKNNRQKNKRCWFNLTLVLITNFLDNSGRKYENEMIIKRINNWFVCDFYPMRWFEQLFIWPKQAWDRCEKLNYFF